MTFPNDDRVVRKADVSKILVEIPYRHFYWERIYRLYPHSDGLKSYIRGCGVIGNIVVITGPCGSGKTRLGEMIERALGVPCISKDSIKELLYDNIGMGDGEFSRKQGLASYRILRFVADKLLLTGSSVVVESNFNAKGLLEFLEPLRANHSPKVLVIHCTAEPETLYRRIRNRAASGERHPGHVDTADFGEFLTSLSGYGEYALPDGDALIKVDTTDFGQIDRKTLLQAISEHIK